MATVDTLLVRIEADMSDLKRSLDKMDKDIKRSTVAGSLAFDKLGAAIKAIAGAVVVQQLARAGASAVLFAADIQEMQSKSAVVFGAFRGDVVDALSEFGDQVGRSRFELEAMASTLQDTFVPLGFAREEASKLSVEMTKLAVDVASFNNASDVETMQAFQSALVGNHETVRRFGIIITEATLNQELMRMGIEDGTRAATEQEKVMARMNLIMNGVTDAQGDAARTADSFANQLKAARSSTDELSNAIGVALMPMATELLTTFNDITVSVLNAGIAMGIFAAEPKKKLELLNEEISEINRALTVMDAMAGATEVGSSARPDAVGKIMDLGGVEGAKERLDDLRSQRDFLYQEVEAIEATAQAAKEAQAEIDKNNASKKTLTKSEREAADAIKESNREIATKTGQLVAQTINEMALAKAIATGNVEAEKQARFQIELNKLKEKYPELVKDNQTALENLANVEVNRTMMLSQQAEALDLAKEKQEEYNRQQEELAKLKPMQDTYLQSVQSMSQGVSNAFADMLMSGKLNMDSLKDIFRNFVRTMIAKAIELYVLNKIMASVFGLPSTTTSTGATVLGKAATGGTIQPNKPYLVGERGPELIVPQSASTVMNAHNTRGAMSGGGSTIVQQTINVTTGVQQTVRTEVMSMLPMISDAAKSAVLDAKRRGGSYGKAFA